MQYPHIRVVTAGTLLGILLSHTARAEIVTFGSGANQFNMEFVEIGSPGNAADTTGKPNPAGSVGYTFQMGKFEVGRDMIIKANAAGGLGITLHDMSSYTGNGVNKPASGVNWFEAAKFVNWLNTNKGFQAAYKFDGNNNFLIWEPGDTGFDASNPYRNSLANFVLPSMDEWYKAAYYDPATGAYFNYPTGSDTKPTAVASGTDANTAVYGGQLGPADITLAGGLSPFGTMGQGGNVWEWEETESDLVNDSGSSARGIRGNDWISHSDLLSSSVRNSYGPAVEGSNFGFRVASLSAVPEPSSLVLCWMGASLLAWWRWRGR